MLKVLDARSSVLIVPASGDDRAFGYSWVSWVSAAATNPPDGRVSQVTSSKPPTASKKARTTKTPGPQSASGTAAARRLSAHTPAAQLGAKAALASAFCKGTPLTAPSAGTRAAVWTSFLVCLSSAWPPPISSWAMT